MPSSTLSTRGRLVLPRAIRGYLGVDAGDRIDFIIGADGEVRLRPALIAIRELQGLLAQDGQAAVTVEEMKEAVGGAHGRR